MSRLRYLPAAAVAGLFAGLLGVLSYHPLDVDIARYAGQQLLHGHLSVYADVPEAQMGPLALLLSGSLPRQIYAAAVCALLALLLLIIERAADWQPGRLLLAGLVLAPLWAFYAMESHADDALVVLAGAGLVLAVRERHEAAAIGCAVLGVAAKPTAIIALPLLLLLGRRALPLALAGCAVVWAPFVLADIHGFLSAGHGIALVQPGSLPALLGADPGSTYPDWIRPAQLLIGLACTGLLARKVGAAPALLLAVLVRVALEPGAWPSYSVAIVALALLVDARRAIPVATLAALGSWAVAYTYPLDDASGLLRVLLLAAAAAAGLGLRRGSPAGPRPPAGPARVPRNSQDPTTTDESRRPVHPL